LPSWTYRQSISFPLLFQEPNCHYSRVGRAWFFGGIFDNTPPLGYNPASIRSDSGNRIRLPAVGDGKVP
jgi:hypothetical protein